MGFEDLGSESGVMTNVPNLVIKGGFESRAKKLGLPPHTHIPTTNTRIMANYASVVVR